MATLAEQFLDDLEEDPEAGEEEVEGEGKDGDGKEENGMDIEGGTEGKEGVEEEEEEDDGLIDEERLGKVLELIASDTVDGLDSDTERDLVMECVKLARQIDEEVYRLFEKLRNDYAPKFPELETLIFNPLDYARVVSKVGNETDLTKVDLASVLPSATVITVTVTASATSGKPLHPDQLTGVVNVADGILLLDEAKKKTLAFVESRTSGMAPNLSALVGSRTAARLIGIAGSLMDLASIPACNIQVLGAKKRRRQASDRFSNPNEGVIFESEIIQTTGPDLRMRACRVLCSKCVLAARVDASGGAPDGKFGMGYREELAKKIEKWNEPPPAKTAKPLPVPDERPGKKRGGRRHRKQKELYAMTDVRKQQNRMAFGKAEETYGNDMEDGLGMLGAEGSKKVRIQVKKTDSVAKAANRRLAKVKNQGGSGARAAGLTTTLNFTDQQGGFELGAMTPMPGGPTLGLDNKDGTKSVYFSSATPFLGSDKRK
mmetsp:Transcript_2130/g.8368  ORF Transcript_2130/g.8368 Transcript_2130/m.8368 type:complete len:488 (+) Transcript_2130:113-1576(+)